MGLWSIMMFVPSYNCLCLSRSTENLNDTSNQISSSNEAYNELKARVKVVAAELMERRIECRELKSHLDDQTGEKEGLRDKITHVLEAQGMDKDQSTTESQQESNDLKGQLMDREQELAKAQGANRD